MRGKAISWNGDYLLVLDQTKLPLSEEYLALRDTEDYVKAIRLMKVRGAPLIGIVAGYAVAQAGLNSAFSDLQDFEAKVRKAIARISATRPTAVNLYKALERMQRVLDDNILRTPREIANLLVEQAKAIHKEEIEATEKISRLGATLIPPGSEVVTICNTGELATAGLGTALGVIRQAFRQNKIKRVWVLETRPYLQGRLTAWELAKDKIPFRVLVDGAVGALFRKVKISASIVGADRIAKNGDFANKIGTYQLAVLSEKHQADFIVCAPTTTFDPNTKSGDQIKIEERDGDEVRKFSRSFVLPKNYPVWNPAFDVTPAELVSYYVSDEGIKLGRRKLKDDS